MTQETDTVTLKPCPFCGGEPTSTYHIRDGRAICCGKCGATVSRYHGNSGQTDAEAIAAWNTRTKAQPASDDWRGDLLRLIAQRAQYATYDDAEDALNWIYHTATNAASESESIYRLAFNTLYVNLKKTNPDHAYTEFSSRIVKGVPWRDAFDGLEDLNTGNLTLTKASADSDALLKEAREDMAMCVAEMAKARGRIETFARCNEDRRISAALGSTCDHLRRRWFDPESRIDTHLKEQSDAE